MTDPAKDVVDAFSKNARSVKPYRGRTDILDRLREPTPSLNRVFQDRVDAANEIERLRASVEHRGDDGAKRLAEIEQRAARATNGPWLTEKPKGENVGIFSPGIAICAVAPRQCVYADPPGGSFPESDRQFIAHAREDIPWLIKTLRTALTQGEGEGRATADKSEDEVLARALCAYQCPECNRPGKELECGEWENYVGMAQHVRRVRLVRSASSPQP